jgi:hypothetical protein
MKRFLLKILSFFLLVVVILVLSLYFVPDVVSKNSLLAALVDKHQMAGKIQTKKIIFIGGSNVSFGLDSKTISDTFKIPVVNMAVHAGLGLEYIVNDSKPYINKGDVVVLIPEYENFYTDNFYGEMELASVLFGIYPAGKKLVNGEQWKHLVKYLPTYSAKKIKSYVSSLFHKPTVSTEIDIYDKRSFNDFGDAYIHWELPNQNFFSCKKNTGKEKINPEVISFLVDFKKYVSDKEAKLVILPPVLETESYQNQEDMINAIEIELQKNNIGFIAKPNRYKLATNYFFNSIYHPNKKGVDLRTRLVIEDLSTNLLNHSAK